PPATPRPALGQHRQQVGVAAAYERVGPRSVDVPQQHPQVPPHAATSPNSCSSAATTSWADTEFRQGLPGTGQVRAWLSRQGDLRSPSSTSPSLSRRATSTRVPLIAPPFPTWTEGGDGSRRDDGWDAA